MVLIFGGFAILHNFVPEGLDQAGWDGFLVLFVTVLLWLTEAVPMAVTSIFALFFGAWVGFETEATILSGFAGTGVFFLLGTMIIGQIENDRPSAVMVERSALASAFLYTFCRCSATKQSWSC